MPTRRPISDVVLVRKRVCQTPNLIPRLQRALQSVGTAAARLSGHRIQRTDNRVGIGTRRLTHGNLPSLPSSPRGDGKLLSLTRSQGGLAGSTGGEEGVLLIWGPSVPVDESLWPACMPWALQIRCAQACYSIMANFYRYYPEITQLPTYQTTATPS